jgi:hypothetical protein
MWVGMTATSRIAVFLALTLPRFAAEPITRTAYRPGRVKAPVVTVSLVARPGTTEVGLTVALTPVGRPPRRNATNRTEPELTLVRIVKVLERPCGSEIRDLL